MVREFLAELFPPGTPAIVRYRVFLFIFCTAVAFHIAWACGLMPGFAGFASASEVRQVAQKVDLILKLQVESRLRALKQEKCVAKTEGLVSALQTEIDRLQQEHRTLDGNYYPLPECREYVIEVVEGKHRSPKGRINGEVQ